MNILQVNTCDTGGGAARVAWNLFLGCCERGHNGWLAVGEKGSEQARVLAISDQRIAHSWRVLRKSMKRLSFTLLGRARLWGLFRSHLERYTGRLRPPGLEDMAYPASWHLLDLAPAKPDLVHGHNLHGSYFDLRVLPWLSRQVSVALTLHDAWLLSGHCAHSFDCERWKTGCGECPSLTIPPAVKGDETAANWSRKKRIYEMSRFHVATPCRWLMDKVKESILVHGMVDGIVIPNGVDLSVFHPDEKGQARDHLKIPQDVSVLLTMATGGHDHPWRDAAALEAAVVRAAEKMGGRSVWMMRVGDDGTAQTKGNVRLVPVAYQRSPENLALYYQASDIYVHPAKADTFPTALLEALACGTPVVATAVGGIPEQVTGLHVGGVYPGKDTIQAGRNHATGILVAGGDAQGLAAAIGFLLGHDAIRSELGANAAADARQRFGLDRQVDAYLRWYEDIVHRGN
jgi:glycosyltransferase involved in cell wall biosynthesis